MSYAVMPMDDWQNIVDSVRAKTGKSDTLKSGEVASEIDGISVGGNTLNEFLKGTKTEITAEDLAGLTAILTHFFQNTAITSIEIPNSVTKFESLVFQNCKNLTTATIGSGVASMSYGTFYGCTGLTSITVDENNKNYSSADGVFFDKNKTILYRYPSQKTEIQYAIPKGVVRAEAFSFEGCVYLTSLIIPDTFTRMGETMFGTSSPSIAEIICLAENPPTIDWQALKGVPTDCIFKVKPTSVEAYKSATNWSARGDYIIALTDEEVLQYGG